MRHTECKWPKEPAGGDLGRTIPGIVKALRLELASWQKVRRKVSCHCGWTRG